MKNGRSKGKRIIRFSSREKRKKKERKEEREREEREKRKNGRERMTRPFEFLRLGRRG
jgi:hypothetical protein